MSTGEQAVASNIVPQTHRIQRWDFRQCQLPDLTQSKLKLWLVPIETLSIHSMLVEKPFILFFNSGF